MAYQSAAGLLAFVIFAWLISENRRQFPLKLVLVGIASQILIALALLKLPFSAEIFIYANRAVLALEASTRAGTSFVFGYIGGGALPFAVTRPAAVFILAFQALPLVLVISALSAVLFYWKILPKIVMGFSWVLEKGMRLGGAEGLGVSANVFVGMVEAPLLIRPYVEKMTRSELFTLMTTGMATIAGTVLVLYASILREIIPDVAAHMLTASIISVPAAVLVSKIMVPETKAPSSALLLEPDHASSAMDALTQGTIAGIQLLLNIIGMIIVLVAVVHLVDLMLGLLPEILGASLSLQRILGWFMSPVVWLMGIPWAEVPTAGALLGTKTILNELIAYIQMTELPKDALGGRSMLIMSYALCGFANPGSLGIMIGGLGGIAPGRREEIVSLGIRSIIAGTIATCMTGAVVGLLF
jgi:concentrative nucleoside transporter, CNT family